MNLKFVSLLATDKVQLPALLYQPDQPTAKAAVWLHGMGDSGVFYKPVLMNALGQQLTERGIALLALNNRGAHNSKSLKIVDETLPEEDRRYQGGTLYELIEDCVPDIEGAGTFLQERGFKELYLLGHSTGANKICAYHVRAKQNPFRKYVLAGPGDDVGLFFKEMGEKRFWRALRYAASKLSSDPLHIMPKYSGMYPFSVQSAYDILNPEGAYNIFPFYEASTERLGNKALFTEYSQIDRPSLVIIGENDEFTYTAGDSAGAVDLFMQHTPSRQLKQTDFQLVEKADHSFHEHETNFASQVADWLAYA